LAVAPDISGGGAYKTEFQAASPLATPGRRESVSSSSPPAGPSRNPRRSISLTSSTTMATPISPSPSELAKLASHIPAKRGSRSGFEEDQHSDIKYSTKSPPPKRRRSVESSQMNPRCTDTDLRVKDAEARGVTLKEHMVRLEGEKKALEEQNIEQGTRLVELEKRDVEQGMRLVGLEKRCEEADRQLVMAAVREHEDRENEKKMVARQMEREAELVSRCEMLEGQLKQVRANQVATSKEQEEMRTMIEGAYIVPSLKDAFVQIDQLFRGLLDRPLSSD